jgi:phosphoribosyl 1,2-cyclic phosphodiesterase
MEKSEKWIDIKFWGVRGSIATPKKENIGYGGNTSCVQVTSSEYQDLLVFDCGSGIVTLGDEIIRNQTPVNGHVFVTHTHWDHVQGIPFFKPFYKPGNNLSLHMYPQMGKSCRDIVKMVMAPVFFPVNINAFQSEMDYVTEDGTASDYFGCLKIEALQTSHPGNTVMYKVKLAGKVIIYCPDNEFKIASEEHNKAMDNFMKGADVLMHDAQYTRETYPVKAGWGHTAWEDIVELASELKVKSLFLMHHDPEASDDILNERSKQLDTYAHLFDTVRFAREGETFRLSI